MLSDQLLSLGNSTKKPNQQMQQLLRTFSKVSVLRQCCRWCRALHEGVSGGAGHSAAPTRSSVLGNGQILVVDTDDKIKAW